MLVLGNTMIMSARERTREYAVMKALGFSAKHLVGLIMGESLFISAVGAGIGLFLTYPLVMGFSQVIPKGFFPVFQVEPVTVIIACSAAALAPHLHRGLAKCGDGPAGHNQADGDDSFHVI